MIIRGRSVESSESPFIIAEIAAAHNGSLERAVKLIEAAKSSAADAVKFQAFTPDTITFPSTAEEFTIQEGPWRGYTLYELYSVAYTPREWFPTLFEKSRELGLIPFASVFSPDDVDFIRQFEPEILKIASFELVDLPLIEHASRWGIPMIMSLGMASEEEKWDAIDTALEHLGAEDVKILSCVSAYPARIEDAVIPLGWADGISDHTIGIEVPIAATALGASIIEKHLTLSREQNGLDDGFASEPHEFAAMVKAVRGIHAALHRDPDRDRPDEIHRPYRRSLYVVKGVAKGETIRAEHVRSIRPAFGLPPKHLPEIIGKVAAMDITAGTATKWDQFE